MFTEVWSGFYNGPERYFGEHTCQKGKEICMWGVLTVIAFMLVYIYSFDRDERLKSVQELVQFLKVLLLFFLNR